MMHGTHNVKLILCVSFHPFSLNLFPETGLRFSFYFTSDLILSAVFQKSRASSSDRAGLPLFREVLLGTTSFLPKRL